MIIRYKKIWGNQHHGHIDHTEFMNIEKQDFSFCCPEMKDEYDEHDIAFSYEYGKETDFGINKEIPYTDGDHEIIPITFCPFCGERITLECIGEYTWKNVPTGNKIIKESQIMSRPAQFSIIKQELDETKPELVKKE